MEAGLTSYVHLVSCNRYTAACYPHYELLTKSGKPPHQVETEYCDKQGAATAKGCLQFLWGTARPLSGLKPNSTGGPGRRTEDPSPEAPNGTAMHVFVLQAHTRTG